MSEGERKIKLQWRRITLMLAVIITVKDFGGLK